MPKTKLAKAAGRFGARYGQYVRRRIADLENKQRKKQHCPICKGVAKRLSKGIWKCKKCKNKFAAHTYFLDEESLKIKSDKIRQFASNNKPTEKQEKSQKKEDKKGKPLKEAKANLDKQKTTKKQKEKIAEQK